MENISPTYSLNVENTNDFIL